MRRSEVVAIFARCVFFLHRRKGSFYLVSFVVAKRQTLRYDAAERKSMTMVADVC